MSLIHLAHKKSQPMSHRLFTFSVIVFLTIVFLPCATPATFAKAHPTPLQENPDPALVIAQTAMTAQNSSNFKFAATQWESLLAQHADSPLVGKAHYNAGVCYLQTNEFQKSIDHLKSSIPKLEDESVQQPQAFLYLGFAQFRLGQQLLPSAVEKEQSTTLLTTAAQTFANLLTAFPDFADADQACYFQGGAFEALNRLEDARQSYAKMFEYPKQAFEFEGLYAIADVNSQLGQHVSALQYYETFRERAESTGGNPLLNDVKFRTGRTMINLAIAEENAGNTSAANTQFTEAAKLLGQVADLDTVDQDESFIELTEEARFQQAYCARRLKQFETAANLYEKIAANPDSPLAAQSLAYSGRNFIDAGNTEKAIIVLEKSIATESRFASESAHWLAGIYLPSDPQKSYDLATIWIPKSADSDSLVPLKMDLADAAYAIPDRRKQAINLFQAISDEHPDHDLAPSALYNSAFTSLEFNDFKTAIEKSDSFQEKYGNSDFLPDTLEVKADACLLDNQPETAGEVFELLVTQFPEHTKNPLWKLRSGLALYLQKKYTETIDQLTPMVDTLADPDKKAEALHWIGSSQFQNKDFASATRSLTDALAADETWRRADETLLALCRAQIATDKTDESQTTAQKLIEGYPDSPLLSELHYYLGENAYDQQQFEDAYINFSAVISIDRESRFVPSSLYNAAWAKMELTHFTESEKLFTDLINNYPDNELAGQAKLGRGAARRKLGNLDSSIVDLEDALENSPTEQHRLNTLYEIGLAQVETKKWPDAIKTFQTLVTDAPESTLLDQYYYELAWAYRETTDEAKAIEFFTKITTETPSSPKAPESNFHVGTSAYNNDNFEEAINSYEKVIQSNASDNIREKAAYKLAWAQYKQEHFTESRSAFSKQIEQFPTGDLFADGSFMVAESHYRLNNHDLAFAAYISAQPAINASTTIEPKIKWLTMLHGSQSANKTKKYAEAIKLVSPLTTTNADITFKQDAWLELGAAHDGLKQTDQAMENYRLAAKNLGKTGARAHCMIGDLLFRDKKFDDAAIEFKLVYFGFGGTLAAEDVKPWQAYAVYETARCSFVQVADAPEQSKPILIAESIKQFEYLLKNYENDRLALDAKKQLETLKRLESQ